MVRLYVQLRAEPGKAFDHSKVSFIVSMSLSHSNLSAFSQWGPEEILVVLNKVFAPYSLSYAEPVDWYTILTSEYTLREYLRKLVLIFG